MVAGSLIGVKADQLEVPIHDSSFDSPLDFFFFKTEIVGKKHCNWKEMCQQLFLGTSVEVLIGSIIKLGDSLEEI